MPMIDLKIQHGKTLAEAQTNLEKVVAQVQSTLGAMVQQVVWQDDRQGVKLNGIGFTLEMRIDEKELHLTGDVPILGRLLGQK